MTNNRKAAFKRTLRFRELNYNGTITAISTEWDRTVCAADIRKFLECEAGYCMDAEKDKKYRASLSVEVGNLLHRETAKPADQRLQDTAEIARYLTDVAPEERMAVAQQVKVMIAKAIKVNDLESIDAECTEHEFLMVWYDKYTDTTWFAKPDKMDLIKEQNGRRYLKVIDQKTGKWRHRLNPMTSFFFGYVAKMTAAMDHHGTVRTVTRYLRDRRGNLLETPEEKGEWIGRILNRDQENALQGIQETVRLMDRKWKSGEFETRTGDHCRRCDFRHTCPANAEAWKEHLAWEAERKALEAARPIPVQVEDFEVAPLSLVAIQAPAAANQYFGAQRLSA
jgi:hypothetical protein